MNADTESISRQSAAARASLRRSWRRPLAPYLFLLPFLLVFAIFFLTPLLQSVVMSVRSYSGPRESHFVGTAHYQYLLQDKLFWVAVANTVSYTLLFLLFQVPMSLAAGGRTQLRSCAGSNRAATGDAAALPGRQRAGCDVADTACRPTSGTDQPRPSHWSGRRPELNWKSDPWLATAAIVLAVLWLTVGWGMMYLLAALQSVSRELYQAAEVDGRVGLAAIPPRHTAGHSSGAGVSCARWHCGRIAAI